MTTRRSIVSVKDDTGAYVKVATPPPQDVPPPPPPPIDKDVSLDNVHERLMQVLDRETHRLLTQSAAELLNKDQGVAFERCVKILREFKKEEREYLEALASTQGKKEESDE